MLKPSIPIFRHHDANPPVHSFPEHREGAQEAFSDPGLDRGDSVFYFDRSRQAEDRI
jgi:hypothetical protein